MSADVKPKFWVGIDVGTHSVGCAAIEIDDDGFPIQILNAKVQIHDSGVDPAKVKSATTRLASSGVARRTRRLVRRRRKRLQALDAALHEWGWFPTAESSDPHFPWRARARLADGFIGNTEERDLLLGVALRHMARHRGWRNPWVRVESLRVEQDPSEQFEAFRERVEDRATRSLDADATIGQLAVAAIDAKPHLPLRAGKTNKVRPSKDRAEKEFSYIGNKLLQSDNANELLHIARIQGIDAERTREMIQLVFAAESPRGAALALVGKDPLPGQRQLPRASKATDAFQRYRIVSVLANLRIVGANGERPLTVEERKAGFDYLINVKTTADPTWVDVAGALGIDRDKLRGTASPTADGERAAARPPVHVTDRTIRTSKVKTLKQWWPGSDQEAKNAVIAVLADGKFDEASAGGDDARELIESLTDEELTALDTINSPAGRAAYSVDSLNRLTRRMLTEELDVHGARMAEFGVAPDWAPPAEPIGAPVGNPAVDRVTKIVARWLRAGEAEWGAPDKIVIEHVRSAFASEEQARKLEYEMGKRYEQNLQHMRELAASENIGGVVRRSDLNRYQAITRQNGCCLYCGTGISFSTAEMDHIVPRAGIVSTNTRTNLVAVCSSCNRSKKEQLFPEWAESHPNPNISLDEALERTRHWLSGPGETTKDHRRFVSEVQARLKKTSKDPEFDGRSMESVAWMANELRLRIASHFKEAGTKVSVYRGAITAEARKASGLEGRIPFIGGGGKTRLDRRHHAVDAAVVSLLDESVARTLAERVNRRQSQQLTREADDWKTWTGSSPKAKERYQHWLTHMSVLADLLTEAMHNDDIPVMEDLRLRLANGSAHDDTIRPLVRRLVSDELQVELIDRASSPSLWVALTRDPDFDPKEGLPANPDRRIRINGTHLGPDDEIGFFGSGAAAIAVRGGYAEIGSTIHHARVYRIDGGKKPTFAMLRVFSTDLLAHRHGDLFTAPILPQSISMRTAPPKLRQAIADGNAVSLGWFVVGDELEIDMSGFKTGQVGEFLQEYGDVRRWKLDGFYSADKLRLRPALIASEGLPEHASDSTKKVVDRPGWLPALNVLGSSPHFATVRRDTLGRPRYGSDSGLPVSWQVEQE
ncbi:MAG: CRISPR-associated protein [Actinomycetales bacterium]|nr:CRISPR-associated protein [Actinomycetales bacterium]